ncbi:hypothetical protein ACOMHN_016542 [Nucella lapillus]
MFGEEFFDNLIADGELGLGEDDQSDISVGTSVSSVHTSDLSDFDQSNISRGIQAWALADSETYYLVDLNIYTGKEGAQANQPLGTHVVVDLVKQFYRKKITSCALTIFSPRWS